MTAPGEKKEIKREESEENERVNSNGDIELK